MVKSIFVTVGTTKFDKLIETVTKNDVLKLFKRFGYEKITLQIGHGTYTPKKSEILKTEYYRLKDSIKEDITEADLVITHCGAGSCLEILCLNKHMVAVINEDLMDNHQNELAEKMADNKWCYISTCKQLPIVLGESLGKLGQLDKYEGGDIKLFSNYLNKCCGFF